MKGHYKHLHTSIHLSPFHASLSRQEPVMHVFDASPSPSAVCTQLHSAVPGAAPQGWQAAGKTTTMSGW